MNKKLFGGVLAVEALAFALLQGGMVTLGLMVAPMLFRTIGSRDLAGRLFGNILGVWVWFGIGAIVVLMATALISWRAVQGKRRLWLARFIVLLPMLGLTTAFAFVLGRMQEMQAAMTRPIEEYPINANPRLEYDGLHKLSGNLLSANVILGLIWLGLSVVAVVMLWNRQAAIVPSDTQEQRKKVALGV